MAESSPATEQIRQSVDQPTEAAVTFVVFDIAGELYAIDARRVQTVVRPLPVTRVPPARDFIEGIINLRGEIVPIVDLRRLFGLAISPSTDETRLIIVSLEQMKVGIIADMVTGVCRLRAGEIQTVIGGDVSDGDFIAGVKEQDGRLLTVLDCEALFGRGRRMYPEAGASQMEQSPSAATPDPPQTDES